ncbi:MAG: hypothetical protein ACTSUE_05170, partial [Promethearchaeota archaeon]
MDKNYKEMIGILEDEGSKGNSRIEAANYFIDLALRGKDIADAIPLLVEQFHDSHQVPEMAPAAEAVVIYCVKHGKLDIIINMIENGEYKMFSLEAVQKAIERGIDITELIPLILPYIKSDEYRISAIVEAHTQQDKSLAEERMKTIATILLNDEKLIGGLSFIVKESAINHVDMTPMIPALVEVLKHDDKRTRRNSMSALRWSIESGTDFSSSIARLKELLHENTGEEGGIAYCLSYHFIKHKEWKQVRELMGSPCDEIRRGVFRSIVIQYNNDSKGIPDLLELHLEGFGEKLEEIRGRIRLSILQAERKRINIIPTIAVLSNLLPRMNGNGKGDGNFDNEEFFEYLYHISAKSTETAESIKKIISEADFKESVFLPKLQKRLNELLDEKHHPVCSICRNIPRRKSYWTHVDLPMEVKKLGIKRYFHDGMKKVFKCRECDFYYFFSYGEHWGDMHPDITYTLNRLEIHECLELLKGKERETFELNLPNLLRRYKSDLLHPVKFAREEAAAALTQYFLKEKNWEGMKSILVMDDDDIKKIVLRSLMALEPNAFPFSTFKDIIIKLSKDSNKNIKENAVHILSQQEIKTGDITKVKEHLHDEDVLVVRSALSEIKKQIMKDNEIDIKPFKDELLAFMEHADRDIRIKTLYILKHTRKQLKGAVLETHVKNLDHESSGIRGDAASGIEDLIKQEVNVSKAIPLMAKLVENNTTAYHAMEAFITLVRIGKKDIKEALPSLVKALEDPNNNYH